MSLNHYEMTEKEYLKMLGRGIWSEAVRLEKRGAEDDMVTRLRYGAMMRLWGDVEEFYKEIPERERLKKADESAERFSGRIDEYAQKAVMRLARRKARRAIMTATRRALELNHADGDSGSSPE